MSSAKHILFHRPTAWDSDVVCSTKTYARVFSQAGYRVSYLQGTINFGHRLLRRGYYETWRKGSRFEDGIWVTSGCSLVPDLPGSRLLARQTRRLSYLTCLPGLDSLVRRSGFGSPDILWTTVPGSSALKDIFPNAKLFFHAIDKYSAYRGRQIAALEAADYARADHIFVIGRALFDHLQQDFGIDPARITNLGQGVALERYQGDLSVPPELRDLPRPIAIWVGVIKKLDVGLLNAAVDEMRKLGGSTVLIGPDFDSIRGQLENQAGLHWIGSRPGTEVPACLRSADIGLMLYDRSRQEVYEGQNPLKLYEYAAAGLPVLSTPHREFETLQPPVLQVTSEDEVRAALRIAWRDREPLRQQALAFAALHSWDACRQRAEAVFAQFGL